MEHSQEQIIPQAPIFSKIKKNEIMYFFLITMEIKSESNMKYEELHRNMKTEHAPERTTAIEKHPNKNL